jgi:hypothetical protein
MFTNKSLSDPGPEGQKVLQRFPCFIHSVQVCE